MPKYTPNLNLYKPDKKDDIEIDQSLADNFVKIDTEVKNVNSQLAQTEQQINDLEANKASKAEVNSLATQKVDKIYVDTLTQSLASGSPKGTFATLSELQTAFPNGNNNIYLVSSDGKWYYWSGANWMAGGEYLASLSSFKNMLLNSNVVTSITTPITNERLFITPLGNWSRFFQFSNQYQVLDIKANHKYYAKTEITPSSTGSLGDNIRFYYEDGSIQTLNGIRFNLNKGVAGILTANKNAKANLAFQASTVGNYERINQILVDLTDLFGEGLEPTKNEFEQLLREFPNSWFDSTTQFNTVQKYLLLNFIKASRKEATSTFIDEDTGITYRYNLKQKNGFIVFNYEEA